MKLKRTRISLLAFALAFAVQLSFALPTARAAQHTNMSGDHQMGIPGSRCRRRCSTDYRRCLRRDKNRRACARRLRNCQRRCPQ